jgi:hypothetical protein
MSFAILAGALAAWALFRPFFGDGDGFRECLRYERTPDIVSLFRGEWDEDRRAKLKLSAYTALCAGSTVAAYLILWKLWGDF